MATQLSVIWSELDHRFVQDAQGAIKVVENVAAVLSSIDNILRTRRGERVMRPNFGSDLADVLFEPVNATVIKFLTRSLKSDIERWDDRVFINSLSILPEPDKNLISITILFHIIGMDKIIKYETEVRGEA